MRSSIHPAAIIPLLIAVLIWVVKSERQQVEINRLRLAVSQYQTGDTP